MIFDTSVYIQALHSGDKAILSVRRAAGADDSETRPLYLRVVVLEEL
jgi:hypothetical protein